MLNCAASPAVHSRAPAHHPPNLLCHALCRRYPEAVDTGVRLRLQVCGSETEVGFWHAQLDGVDYTFLDHPAFSHWAGERWLLLSAAMMLQLSKGSSAAAPDNASLGPALPTDDQTARMMLSNIDLTTAACN